MKDEGGTGALDEDAPGGEEGGVGKGFGGSVGRRLELGLLWGCASTSELGGVEAFFLPLLGLVGWEYSTWIVCLPSSFLLSRSRSFLSFRLPGVSGEVAGGGETGAAVEEVRGRAAPRSSPSVVVSVGRRSLLGSW